jgi:uncharacterized protein YbcI
VSEKAKEGVSPSGGEMLSAISTRIVGLLRENYGRGPMRAKTYVLDDLVVCVLRNGFIPIEETMMQSGKQDQVLEMRRDFQKMMGLRYKEVVEELTGRRVTAFLSQAHVEPDITLEIFLLETPLEGFGAVELTEPAKRIDGD